MNAKIKSNEKKKFFQRSDLKRFSPTFRKKYFPFHFMILHSVHIHKATFCKKYHLLHVLCGVLSTKRKFIGSLTITLLGFRKAVVHIKKQSDVLLKVND